MRIALYHNLPSGGARRATLEMVKGLAACGHTIDEFCPQTAEREGLALHEMVGKTTVLPFKPRGIAPRRIPLLTPYWTAARLLRDLAQMERVAAEAARAMDAGSYDVAFTHDCLLVGVPDALRFLHMPTLHYCHHGAGAFAPVESLAARPAGWVNRAKSVYYAAPVRAYPALRERRARANIRATDRVLTNSCFARERIRATYGVDSEVCYLGVDTATFRPLGVERGEYALSVGALHYHKGYRFLVAALGRIPERLRPPLVIAANAEDPGEREGVEKLARECGVRLRIERVARDGDLVELYNRAAVFVYTPIHEPWGLAAVEAMSCGAAVVAVGEGGVGESVTDGESGLLVARDEAAFADAVARVLSDAALAERLGRGAAAVARRRFPWPRTVEQVESALRETAAGAR